MVNLVGLSPFNRAIFILLGCFTLMISQCNFAVSASEEKIKDKNALAQQILQQAAMAKNQPEDGLNLRLKALKLMGDDNPRKPELLVIVNSLETSNKVVAKCSANNIKLNETKIQRPKRSDPIEQTLKQYGAPYSSELVRIKEAAELATRCELPMAGTYWMMLAFLEARNKNLKLAEKYALTSIELYDQNDARFTRPNQIFTDICIPTYLATYQTKAAGNALYKQAIDKVQKTSSKTGLQSQMQLASYILYCVDTDQSIEAVQAVVQILDSDLNQGTYTQPNPLIYISRPPRKNEIENSFEAIELVLAALELDCEKGNFTLSALTFPKLIAVESQQYKSDDYRLIRTKAVQAKCLAMSQAKNSKPSKEEANNYQKPETKFF